MTEEYEECPYCKKKYRKSNIPKNCPDCGMCLGNCD